MINVNSYEERESTLAMLKLLALGQGEIEQVKFKDVEDVFASLDVEDTNDLTIYDSAHPWRLLFLTR